MTIAKTPKEPTYIYNAKVDTVIDGDTVDLAVDLGMRVSLQIRTRLYGINAPEVSTIDGKASRAALRKRLPPATPVVIKTFKDPGDKYGRWLAVIAHEGDNINQWLVAEKLAVPYAEGA